MTLQNGDFQRKSSVYNQTGQNYFEQLSSYNRMNSHLRRILMAQSVVDARNQKYIREKRLSSRSSSCSKSLDQILSRRDFIDGVAYDTEHHPIDLLRMRLGCDPNCLHMARKRSLEQSYRSCSNIRCRGGSPKTPRRPEIKSDEIVRCSRTSTSGSPIKYPSHSYGISRSSLLTGRRIDQQPDVVESRRHKINDSGRNGQNNRHSKGFEAINETYSYDSSFESSSDTSGIDSPIAKNCECPSSRPNFDSSPERTGNEVDREFQKIFDNSERNEEAKYAKFLYNITQEIVLNGLYTDKELHEVFKKHVEMNCGCLDKERMLSEINQLKMSLNVKESSVNEKFPEHMRNDEKTKRFQDSQGRSHASQATKNAILLVDTSPEVLLTEREVLVTLMEMKLDPQQVRTICKSLRNKIKETNETDSRDEIAQVSEEETSKKIENCKCQCRGENQISSLSAVEKQGANLPIKTEESQTEENRPKVVSQASQVEEQTKEITTSISVGELLKETRDISSSNSELQKLPEDSQRTVLKSDEISTKSKTSDFSQHEEPKSRKTSLPSDEDEKIQNSAKTSLKKEKIFNASKKSTELNDQIVKKDSQRVLKSIQDVDNKIGQVRKTSERKSTNSKKSSSPTRNRKSTRDDRKTSDSITSKENLDLDKSRVINESIKIETIVSDEEATTTEIATEKDSHEVQHEKIEEITDDELASLPEDISREIDESLSTIDSEKGEEITRASKVKSVIEKSNIIEHESSDEKKILHGIEESEEEEISTSLKLSRQVHQSSKSANDSEDYEDDVVVGKTKKKSKYDDIKNDKSEKLSAPSSPNNRRSKTSNGKETSVPQKIHRKSIDSGDKKTDVRARDPRLSIEFRSRRPTRSEIPERNESPQRSRTVTHDSIWQRIEPACNQEGSSCKRRKKNELVRGQSDRCRKIKKIERRLIQKFQQISSCCYAKQTRRCDFQRDSDMSLTNVRGCVREPIGTIYCAASITTESEISIRNEEQEDSAIRNLEDFLARDEDNSKFEAESERSSFPWLSVEKEMELKRSEEKLEVSGPRRDTIHRRTSLIRSVRIAMESLKNRRKSSNASSPGSRDNSADAERTSNKMLLPESFENRQRLEEEKLKLKISSDTSYGSASPITLRSPGEPKDREKLSRTPSIDPSPGTLRSSRESKDREKLLGSQSMNVPSTTLESPRESRDRKKLLSTPSIDVSPVKLQSPRESKDQGKLSSTPSIDVSPTTSRSPRESKYEEKLSKTPPSIIASRTTLKSPRESKDREKLSKTQSTDVSTTAVQVYRISDKVISLVPATKNRCRPDCRGPWSSSNHSRRSFQSPNRRKGHASRSPQSFDSTKDNQENID